MVVVVSRARAEEGMNPRRLGRLDQYSIRKGWIYSATNAGWGAPAAAVVVETAVVVVVLVVMVAMTRAAAGINTLSLLRLDSYSIRNDCTYISIGWPCALMTRNQRPV